MAFQQKLDPTGKAENGLTGTFLFYLIWFILSKIYKTESKAGVKKKSKNR